MRGRRLLTAAVTLLCVGAGLELAARAVIHWRGDDPRLDFRTLAERRSELRERLASLREPGRQLQLDAELGWVYVPVPDREGQSGTGPQGARGRRVYDALKPRGTLRIAAFGGSFVYASEVSDADAWSAQLEALDPRVEVVNYGVGGYGTDQALLLYERIGDALSPDLVLLGFTELDFKRNVTRFTGFRGAGALSKPRFRLLPDGSLELVPNPFPPPEGTERLMADPRRVVEAAPHDFFFEPWVWKNPWLDRLASVRVFSVVASRLWRDHLRADRFYRGGVMNVRSRAFALQRALILAFEERAERAGREFLLVIFSGNPSVIWGSEPARYTPLIEALPDTWILDLGAELRRDPQVDRRNLLEAGGHLSGIGNAAVARILHRELERRDLLP